MAMPTDRAATGHSDVDHGPDAVGVTVLGCCAAWAVISATGREARPEGVLLAVLVLAGGYAGGRICGSVLPVTSSASAGLGALCLVLVTPHGLPAVPFGGLDPPGGTGATAALLVLSAGATCCAAAAAGRRPARLLLWLSAFAPAGAGLAIGSPLGCAAAAGVVLCSLGAVRVRRRLPALAACALVTAVLAGGSWAVAERALPEAVTVAAEGTLTPHRVQLWEDAADLAEAHPLLGAGPGRFADLSPTAQQAVHSDGKPHSAPLQQAAEQGTVGVVLLGALYCWMLYGLWRSPRPTPVVLGAGTALTGLAALACVGNPLSFTPVTAGAGLLAGLAMARPGHEGRRLSPTQVPPVRERSAPGPHEGH
ncbi:O-antigen ligase family protein [Streptomyces sp. NPDC059176]|uniref:O-antigen ligase family protein n=1 Tax=unclassified Streptomyces TaxID=2593676 RepID=UPI0036840360